MKKRKNIILAVSAIVTIAAVAAAVYMFIKSMQDQDDYI